MNNAPMPANDPRANVEDVYELSPLQQGFLFHHLRDTDGGDYVEQMLFRLAGDLDLPRFKAAWETVVARHPALRSSFQWEGLEQPLQVVHRRVAVPVQEEDWSALAEDAVAARLAEWLAADRRRGFEVSRAPLLRLTVLRLRDRQWQIVWTHSHLLLDGWSLSIVLREVLTAYARSGAAALPPAPKYRDFIKWVRGVGGAAATSFWADELGDFSEPTPLPVLGGRSAPTGGEAGGEETVRWSADATTELKTQVATRGVTLSTVLASAWALVLARVTGEQDIVFGTTVAGRPPALPRAEDTVGLFINTLPVRVRVPESTGVGDWLQRQQRHQAALREHEQTPLAVATAQSGVAPGRELFRTLYVFENYPGASEAAAALPDGLHLVAAQALERTHYPLTIVAALDAGELVVRVLFDGREADRETAATLAARLRLAVAALVTADDRQAVGQLDLLLPAERTQLAAWETGPSSAAAPLDIVGQVLEQAARTPHAVAVSWPDRQLTYAELDRLSAVAARRLRAAGAGPETIVALALGRSPDWPVAVLATLRAGAAFLPVDPDYPAERIRHMLSDSGANVVVIGDTPPPAVTATNGRVLAWSDLVAATDDHQDRTVDLPAADAAQAAYVIYTSGSTGRPKGVVVTRGAMSRLARDQGEFMAVRPTDRVLQFASPSFDASVLEWVWALPQGAALVGAPAEQLLPGEPLAATLAERVVSLTLLPPSTLAQMPEGAGGSLRVLVVGGEACRPELVERWSAADCRFVNLYGPTENTVLATGTELGADDRHSPIGAPLVDLCAYVLDTSGRRVPPGAAGELYLGGAALARGYLGQAGLTAAAFEPDDASATAGARRYRTGDKVRWGADGRLEFLGRIDRQVKLRGYRIELGEIETRLMAHPGVREAAVRVRGGEQLVAWVVPRDGAAADPAEWAAWLRQSLPRFMVPGAWCGLTALPQTRGGKLDEAALPEPDADGGASTAATGSVASPLVAIVTEAFAEVLGGAQVGPRDNFFALGGHSLSATRLLARLRERLAPGLPLRVIFEAPTPEKLAAEAAAHRTGGSGVPPPLRPRDAAVGPAPASFAQQRFWLLERLTPGNAANHLQLTVRLRGAFDADRCEQALRAVVAKHDVLRTTFALQGDDLRLVDLNLSALPWAVTTTTDWESALATDFDTPFDLVTGPLWRARLVRVAATEHVLGFTFHHAIFDGWSAGVLVRDLTAAYGGQELVAPSIGYADYAAWQRAWLGQGELARQLDYWREHLRAVPALDLPTDRPRPAVQTYCGGSVERGLPTAAWQALKTFARREGVTPFMLLLAGWQALIQRTTGQTDFAVGTPVAGRQRAELEGLVGLLLNTLVLRADLAGEPSFGELLRRVRATTLDAYARQDAPFEQVVEAINPPRDLSRPPLFQTLVVLQNAPTAEVTVEGVQLEAVRPAVRHAKYELTLGATERPDGLELSLEYNTDLFDELTAKRWLDRFLTLLAAAVRSPKHPLSRLSWLPTEEAGVLAAWNRTARPYVAKDWIHERPVRQSATAVALRFGGTALTYAEFNGRVDAMAAALQARGVGPESRVGVCLERSFELVIALHAVMRAGGAYVPLDPGYPTERVRHMVRDAEVAGIVTTASLRERLPVANDSATWDVAELFEPDATLAPVGLSGDHAAYLIYTSGSTGLPKGAINTHAAIRNRLDWMQEALPLTAADRVLQKTPFSFDVSVWEFFWPLMTGATLVVAEPEVHKDPARLVALICAEQITTLHFVPSMLRAFLEAPGAAECRCLRQVVCSGEALPRELVERFHAVLPTVALHNLYGPTEAAVDVTWQPCPPGDIGPVPIGRPIANLGIHILDPSWQPVPIGVPGEICLAGLGLGRGYHRRAGLTAERWIPQPAETGGAPGARLYRTGDLGRWRPDGTVEYLDRLDSQVKLRGFRIELGEIEAVLRDQPAVADAAVLLREDTPGDERLAAYVVPKAGAAPTPSALRHALAERLPDYMLPAAWVMLETLPLSPSGKLDRRALPPPISSVSDADQTVPPEGPVEELVAAQWAEVLQVPMVGREDNFFVLGGHSLLATQLISRLREQLKVELPLMDFFAAPTVAGCALALLAVEPEPGHVEKHARARLRLRNMSDEEKARLLAAAKDAG